MKGLAARILPRVVIPTLIAGTVFGLSDWYLSRETALEEARVDLEEASRVAAGLVQEELRGVEHVADVVLTLDALDEYLGSRKADKQAEAERARLSLEAAVAHMTDARGGIEAFEMFEASGERVVTVPGAMRVGGPDVAQDSAWFADTMAHNGWRFFPEGERLRMSRKGSSRDEAGPVVVSMTVSRTALVGRAISLLEQWCGGTNVALETTAGDPIFASGDPVLESALTARQPLVGMDAALVVGYDSTTTLAEVRRDELKTAGLLMGLCGGLALLLVFVVQRVVLAPIHKLIELAGAFRSGAELPERLTSEAQEICSLENTLRAAAEEARSSAHAHSNMNHALEERVSARTADLERMRDQALEASRAKSQFLANMSHEIRTPMNGVLGMAEILESTELTEEQTSYLDVIRRSGDSLLGVINDILDFSKIEAGKIDLEEVDFELVSSVHDVAALLAERAEQKGVELVFDADPRLPSHVIGDPARIRQVMTNLVGNAIKFTKKGTVQVRVRYHDKAQGLVEFQVKDSGIGIPQDALASIFDSFSQADISTTRKFGGTGLGLTISRKLVELMGGKLEVTSVVGEGSNFSFVLKMGVSRQASNKNTAADLLAGRRVLIVDDNQSNRRIFERQFKAIGVETISVEGGLEALQTINEEWAEGRGFDFAVLDYQMPHMSGVELADRLAPMCAESGMQLVLLSSALVLERGEGKALARRLTKPVRADLLFSTLAGLLPEGAQPLEVAAPLPAPKKREISMDQAHRVLLAEDNRVNQLVATKLLEGLGFRVDLAENGQEALKMATQHDYPIILMDCQMPVMDGYQATAEIKYALPEQLIIAMTANAMEGDREKCLAAGMDDYVTKPIKREVLAETLARHLSSLPRA